MSTPAVNRKPPVMPGWFGKLPALGDFASRRLPDAFVQGWDAWLQRELARSRATLGARWLDTFLVAPVRRFWLAGGLLGREAWVGVWMPSVDAVGRHYPFTITAPYRGSVRLDGHALPGHAAWFDGVDAIARGMLDPTRGVDELERALAVFAQSPRGDHASGAAPGAEGSLWWCAGAPRAEAWRAAALPAGAEFDRLLHPCP